MSSLALSLPAVMATGLLAGPALRDQKEATQEAVALAEGVQRTKDSLVRGLSASARYGEPIAVAFELRQGRLQLSVCTVWRETFWNVMVDPAIWKVVAVEPITSGDALAAAHAQHAAMAKAKWSLYTVAVNTLKAHRGFSLVSIVPSLRAMERPMADVTLVKGDEWKTVSVVLTY